MPLSIFRNRVVAISSLTSFLVGTALFGSTTFIPLFVQGTFGGSATESGSVLTPLLLGWVIMALIAGRLMMKIGYRPTAMAGLVLVYLIVRAVRGGWRRLTRRGRRGSAPPPGGPSDGTTKPYPTT